LMPTLSARQRRSSAVIVFIVFNSSTLIEGADLGKVPSLFFLAVRFCHLA
jgi:hypothetical protein